MLLLTSAFVSGRIPVCSRRTFRSFLSAWPPRLWAQLPIHRADADEGRSLGLVIPEAVHPFGGTARALRTR
jgi:hypothetical protein